MRKKSGNPRPFFAKWLTTTTMKTWHIFWSFLILFQILKSYDKMIIDFWKRNYRGKATFFLHITCNVNIVINDSKQTKRSFVVCFQFHTPTATFYNAERMDSSVSFFLHGICSMQGRLCAWKGLLPSKCQKTFMFPSILSQKYESISELHISKGQLISEWI